MDVTKELQTFFAVDIKKYFQKNVIIPEIDDGVLLGSAILAAVAAGTFPTIDAAQLAMSNSGQCIEPDCSLKLFYDQKTRGHFKQLTR